MQLSGSRTMTQRGVATRRRGQSMAGSRPATRYVRSAMPSRTPVRTFAQAGDSAVTAEKTAEKKTSMSDILELVKPDGAGLLDLTDEVPEQVTTLTPEDNQLCIDYATWAWASYDGVVSSALDKLNTEPSIKKKLIPSSLVILSGSNKLSYKLVFKNVKTDTQALMGLQDDGKGGVELVIAFRGSEPNASDWLTDFLIDMDPAAELVESLDKKLQIHSGFMDSANDFLKDKSTLVYGTRDATVFERQAFDKLEKGQKLNALEQAIVDRSTMNPIKTLKQLGDQMAQQYNKPITKVVVCGHSLGGALATLTSYWCRKVGWPNLPVEYYSYGAPRVANNEFAAEWNNTMIQGQPAAKVFRVMHRRDLVSAVPPADFPIPITSDPSSIGFDRYVHVDGGVLLLQPGKFPMIDNQGNPKRWPELAEDSFNGWQAQRRRRPRNLLENDSIIDHALFLLGGGYIPALQDALRNYSGKYEPLEG